MCVFFHPIDEHSRGASFANQIPYAGVWQGTGSAMASVHFLGRGNEAVVKN
jgi:hypothetical protein